MKRRQLSAGKGPITSASGNRPSTSRVFSVATAKSRRADRMMERMPGTNPSIAPPVGLRPMSDFDPSQPAILHDARQDRIVTWIGEHQHAFRTSAKHNRDGTGEWNGYLFDGWGNVLGG